MYKLKLTLEESISTEEVLTYLKKKYDVSSDQEYPVITKYNIDRASILNKKQAVVLEHLAEGLKYTEIAEKMNMTVDGVRFYVKAIYRKLNVDNAVKAIREYQKQQV